MIDILRREAIYFWYYFSIQFEQIFGYWVLGMLIGSFVSVFIKDHIHRLFCSISSKRLGALGIVIASALGIASPLCMYGTIPIAASFSRSGMSDDWLAAFMMSSILLNPQLIVYSAALGTTALFGGNEAFGVFMAATIGVPLYMCGGGTIPLLQTWLYEGMSMGSAASFMLTGPATKITNLGALKIVLGIRRFLLYLLFIMVSSFAVGIIVNIIV